MEHQIKNAFAAVTMPPDCAETIAHAMSTQTHPLIYCRRLKPMVVVAIILMITLLAGTATAVVQEIQEKRAAKTQVISFSSNESPPVEKRGDRLWFICQGQEIDITDQISEETPFIYTIVKEDGEIHYLVVGGTPDDYGYAEFLKFGSHNAADEAMRFVLPSVSIPDSDKVVCQIYYTPDGSFHWAAAIILPGIWDSGYSVNTLDRAWFENAKEVLDVPFS